MSLFIIRKQEPLGDILSSGKLLCCPCCGQIPLVHSLKTKDYVKKDNKRRICRGIGIRYVSAYRSFSQYDNAYFLFVDHSCPFCGKVKDYFASFSKNELIAVWNSIVNSVLLVDELRISDNYPPDVQYRTILDLLRKISSEELKMVQAFIYQIETPLGQLVSEGIAEEV